MTQLVLLLALVAVLAGASAATATANDANEFEVPCDDDGLAHIPDLPEGARRPYSVRKRSRTVHRDTEVTDDTPKLPPGQRRFDAVLPDEQGSDITSSTPTRGQRQLPRTTTAGAAAADQVADDNDGNEVPEQPEPLRRASRRPAYPKKAAVPRARKLAAAEEENYPVGHPGLHDPKQDAVVDSYEAVRKYPTHLPYDDDEALQDDNDVVIADNAVRASRPADQLAQEDFSTENVADPDSDSDPDLPPGYRSKFPARTFASDAGGTGDVLRIKPRKRVNQYNPDGAHAAAADAAPTPSSPTPSPERRRQPARRPVALEEQAQQQPRRGGPGGRQQHLVSTEEPSTFPSRRRHDGDAVTEATVDAEPNHTTADDVQTPSPRPRRPLRRRPRPRPAVAQDDGNASGDPATEQQRPQQQEAVLRRRRPRPQPVSATAADENVLENAVAPEQQADVQPRRRPLRRRPRPRPTPSVATEEHVDGDVDSNAIVPQTTVEPEPRRQQAPRRRPRPGQEARRRPPAVVADEHQDEDAPPRSRGHGRRLSVGSAPAENLPLVQVEHDGTAAEKKAHEPTLVRSAVKKAPAGGGAGNPSPALIQKIVKNTLRRLKPQIAEHEGDVGVDILVKIIQVDE